MVWPLLVWWLGCSFLTMFERQSGQTTGILLLILVGQFLQLVLLGLQLYWHVTDEDVCLACCFTLALAWSFGCVLFFLLTRSRKRRVGLLFGALTVGSLRGGRSVGSLRHTQDSKGAFVTFRRRGRLGSLASSLRHTQDGKRAFCLVAPTRSTWLACRQFTLCPGRQASLC